MSGATVIAVHRRSTHRLAKDTALSIHLIAGIGVEDDVHRGATVKHRSRVARNAEQPNLRQVHLIANELHDELCGREFAVGPGQMGENITTRDLDLLALPTGTRLHLGAEAVIEITGLRNPCGQLDDFMPGLKSAVLDRDADGKLIRRIGIMSIVITGGDVRAGDAIRVELPAEPHVRLECV
jgi:MOSC domain